MVRSSSHMKCGDCEALSSGRFGIGPALIAMGAASQAFWRNADGAVGRFALTGGDRHVGVRYSQQRHKQRTQSQTQNVQGNRQQFQQEFQQLGQDLQSGNLSAAQSDFATLQQNAPPGSPLANLNSTTQGSNSLTNTFSQLSQELQSGNVSGAQSDYSTIQQDLQSQGQSQGAHGHHHHHGGGGGGAEASAISQEFQQLGQALQWGDLANAQQAYTSLQQDFEQFSSGNSSATRVVRPAPSASPNISVNAKRR